MPNQTAKTVKTFQVNNPQEQELLFSTDNFLEGYISDRDPLTIPDNALTYAKDVEILRGMLFRRNGLVEYPNTQPNSNKVLNIFAFYQSSTGLNLIRADRQKLYRSQSSGWTEYPPNPGAIAFTGSDTDYFSFAFIDDRAFVSNNGVDEIREIDPTIPEYKALGNAPRARYICTAFDRILGANITGAVDFPTEIDWSGNQNYDEWDPLVDSSAGTANLLASPSTVSDDITGIFFNANTLIIPRQRSIWFGSHIDSNTNPFIFFSALPRIGCDLPRTIFLTDQGLVWTSFQNSCVYAWDLTSQQPEILTFKISRQLKNDLQQSYEIWASYSYDTKKYSLFISSSSSSTVKCYTYDFLNKSWVYHEYPMASCTSDLDFASSSTTIDELVGTIAGLIGPMDSLGGIVGDSTRFFGHSDGNMSTYTYFSGIEDTSNISADDLGSAFTHDIRSKEMKLPLTESFVNLVNFSYKPYSEGTLSLMYSKDDGATWTTIKTQTVDSTMLQKNLIFQLRRAIKAKRLIWRLTSSDVMMSHNGLDVQIMKAGVIKNGY